jgi:V-type H+-transporting ATPase subunit a
MFGDIGHGFILFLLGLLLCLFSSLIKNRFPSLRSLVEIRYLLLLMGLFATFCGLVYNDFMAIPLEIFYSCYDTKTGEKLNDDCVYPLGVDPIWYLSNAELSFLNSLKMKISVIIGVL